MGTFIEIDGVKFPIDQTELEMFLKNRLELKFAKKFNQSYYYIDPIGVVSVATEKGEWCDYYRYEVANYCTDKGIMKQRALHEVFNRLLWRYSMTHGGDKIIWANKSTYYVIYYNHTTRTFGVDAESACQNINAVYFCTEQIAKDAIDKVVLPFMKEHPEFIL